MTAACSSPSRSAARSVPNSGTPRMKLWVPSIGSRYQRTSDPPAALPYSSPTTPCVGNVSAIRSRIRRSIAWSAAVTNDPSAFVSIGLVRPERRQGDRVGFVAAGQREDEPGPQLGVGPAAEPETPVGAVPVMAHRGSLAASAGRHRLGWPAHDRRPTPRPSHEPTAGGARTTAAPDRLPDVRAGTGPTRAGVPRQPRGRDIGLGAIAFAATLVLLLGATGLLQRGGATAEPSGPGSAVDRRPRATSPSTSAVRLAQRQPGVPDEPARTQRSPARARPRPRPATRSWSGPAISADCGSIGDEDTATLLDGIEGTVFTAGDNAYERGTADEFRDCYEPSWGRHRDRTRPAPGNHDWGTRGLAGYRALLRRRGGRSRRQLVVLVRTGRMARDRPRLGMRQGRRLRARLATGRVARGGPRGQPGDAAPSPSSTSRGSAPATNTATIRRWTPSGGPCTPPASMSS